MENYPRLTVLFVVLLLTNIIVGHFPSIEKLGNLTLPWPSEVRTKFLTNGNLTVYEDSKITYLSTHKWHSGGGTDNYYGAEATLDVYGFDLQHGQASAAAIWIINRGDGQRSSFSGIQFGWHIFPWVYNDSHTHFYTSWISGGYSGKGCTNMICPGFHKTSSSIAPGHVISSVWRIPDKKSFTKLRIFKAKSGDWHIHFGANGDPKPVGYYPKSLIPGLIGQPVEISFGGYVTHRKSRPSPPMGSGYVSTSKNAAAFGNLMLIDADGNDHILGIDLPSTGDRKGCYTPSKIDMAQFFYGCPTCVD